jgi:alpha-L-fucosidase 2
MILHLRNLFALILTLLFVDQLYSQFEHDTLLVPKPEHGFVSTKQATKWEESMLTGNGTIGAMVLGGPQNQMIILSHEKLFMPEYPPTEAPPLYKYIKRIRKLALNGHGDKAAELMVRAGKEVGINKTEWTDPLVPACQLEIKSLSDESVNDYARSVNYETGEAVTAWKSGGQKFNSKIFFSRADSIGVLKILSNGKSALNFKFTLDHLPYPKNSDEDFNVNDLISESGSSAENNNLYFTTTFKKRWKNSLNGYRVSAVVINSGGKLNSNNGWIEVRDADQITVFMNIKLSYSLPLQHVSGLDKIKERSYDELLEANRKIQSEMFNRYSLRLDAGGKNYETAEQLYSSSSFGSLNPAFVNQLCEAARYTLICSTGELPPTLQGIWGGTWLPAWSSDFTLNGNVPSAIASGLSCNFEEVMRAYLDYMFSMFNDFKNNARGLYKAPGIFVPSRSSNSGSTYHFLLEYPHLFWYAGAAWTSRFFYDYWQYTHDEQFLKQKVIPFMEASADFYQFILTKDKEIKYMFVPSYSPENAPPGYYPLAVNATMDVASVKELMRNLLTLSKQGWIKSKKTEEWTKILKNLPDYEVDKTGDLKEWIWPAFGNQNEHRHASHLYPLFYEPDPEFENQPELRQAARTAIENRLEYRRKNNGGEMAFGLVQLGLAAAHIKDTAHAYECIEWLCSSYWSPAFTSYHNPGEIFNVDICGGLPAVITEMIIQSSADEISLLPALPQQWPAGEIKGVLNRCGVKADLQWKDGKPVKAVFTAERNTRFKINYENKEWLVKLEKGQTFNWNRN